DGIRDRNVTGVQTCALPILKRPLIVFTPKSMLRLKAAASSLEQFTTGTFQPVIADPDVDAGQVDRIVLVSGKLYWELAAARTEQIGRASCRERRRRCAAAVT